MIRVRNFQEVTQEVLVDDMGGEVSGMGSNQSPAQQREDKVQEPVHEMVGEFVHFALITVFDDGQCTENMQLLVKVVIQEREIDLIWPVKISKDIAATPVKLSNMIIHEEQTQELVNKIVEKLVVEVYMPTENISPDTSVVQIEVRYEVLIDKNLQPMSEVVAESKQKNFEEMLKLEEDRSDDHKIDLEL